MFPEQPPAPVLVRVVRDGVVESQHRGSVVVADAEGRVLAALGDAHHPTYVRSAAKPFQAVATLALLARAGVVLDTRGLAIATASHEGTADHQVEAARLLALAGLDEGALRCPPSLPGDEASLIEQGEATPLAHNCSGKHAAFLLAQVTAGGAPQDYLSLGSVLQRRVHRALAELTDTAPTGPGVDGCGAPAWVIPLLGLATGFARLALGTHGLAPVAGAMRAAPDLVGGEESVDTRLMRGDRRVVAKRGAEAVLAAGLAPRPATTAPPARGLGVAVKVEDGGARAVGPVAAAVLAALGATVPDAVAAPPVLGGGVAHGALEVAPELLTLLAGASV